MLLKADKDIVIEEQGPRDGFQSVPLVLPTETKIGVIEALVEAGLSRVQICSFVHPRLVPQMADAEALCAALPRKEGVVYSGLALNEKGVERAIAAGLDHIAASISVSDSHSLKNTRMSLQDARSRFGKMVQMAKSAGLKVRGGLQCVFGCRIEGPIEKAKILDLVKSHLDLGVDELALADSTGMGHPALMQDIVGEALDLAASKPVFLHLHDTEGKGIANALAAINVGARHFDTGLAGMGGCPFIKGATGNIATEDLIHVCHQMGLETGIDLHKVAAVSHRVEAIYETTFPGKMHRVLDQPGMKVAS